MFLLALAAVAYGYAVDGSDVVTSLEAAFLEMERPGLPMHVAGVVLVSGDPPVTMGELRQVVCERIPRLTRFRQRVRDGRWVTVGRQNVARHLIHDEVPAPGRMAQFNALCARIHEQPLRRDMPLWEIHLVDGLRDGRQAVIVKTHHAITDGIAGVAVAEALFDRAAVAHHADRPNNTFGGHESTSALAPLQALLGAAVTAASGPIALPGPFDGPVGPRRSVAITEMPLRVVREAKHRYGGTVDDVVVAVVAAGLRDYLHDIGYPEPPRALRAMLPVSTCGARPDGVGNHVTAVFVDLPMRIDDMKSLVHAVAASKSVLRAAHAAAGVEMLVHTAGLLPAPIYGALVRLASEVRGFNLVLSDVPAPDEAMFLLGRRIVGTYPMMPLGGQVGLSIAVLGMAGKLCVGVTADPDLVPSAQRIASAIESVVSEIDSRQRHFTHAA
jgi:diacylglycerol O-acyltransferase / wax synthase